MDHDLYFTRAEAARVSNEETTESVIIIIITHAGCVGIRGLRVLRHRPHKLSMVVAKD